MRRVLALILAGGKGTRLEPLTRDRAKPAVPFGGDYRIIDFTLSNCINSGLRQLLILTQYKAASLSRHIDLGWRFLCYELGEFVDVVPPQQRIDENWYKGTADAVYQNIYSIERYRSDHILILSGDHIYKMDYAQLVKTHIENNAAATIGCLPVSLAEGTQFGVMQVDGKHRIINFEEKPSSPKSLPADPTQCLASMGIYVFNTRFLFEELCRDATVPSSSHDFGKDIIPHIIDRATVQAYPFEDKNTGRKQYWRDVGTLDAFYEANMDLVNVDPELNLYDQSWPIRTYHVQQPPAKFVFAQGAGDRPRIGHALDSMVSAGCILSGGTVRHSVLSPGVRVNSWAEVDDSILFEGVDVGRGARIRRSIVDKRIRIPEGMQIGYDRNTDLARGFTVTETGITVVGKAEGMQLSNQDDE